MNSPVFIVEYDDPDVDFLCEHIAARVLRLGLSSDQYSLAYRSSRQWEIGDGESKISFNDVHRAPFVWYRRWKVSPPAPAATAATEFGPAAAAFIERQWETTLTTILQVSFTENATKWSRGPHRLENKIHTNHLLDALGLLPETRIALTPPCGETEWVWKPLHADQSVGAGRAAVIAVTPVDQDVKQPCPGFYQRRVDYETELRLAYAFGEVAAVSQEPETETELIDKRYVDMFRTPFDSRELIQQARRVAHGSSLNMFTADVLLDCEGRFWWVDVNQDGLFCAADSPDGHLLTTVRNLFHRKGGTQ